MTIDEYKKIVKKKNKFNAQRVTIDGINFPSQLHGRYYLLLKALRESGIIHYFLREVPIRLPGGVKYYADFIVFYQDGLVEYVDVKGKKTQTFIIKKKLVESLYPIKIKCVYSEDF